MKNNSPNIQKKEKCSRRKWYDNVYQQGNYFNSREWLFYPYIKTLLSIAKIRKNSKILDLGCGQGFFTYLFAIIKVSKWGHDKEG